MSRDSELITIENTGIIFRNFEGREGQFNAAGIRSFGLLLPEDVVDRLTARGYRIKRRKTDDPDIIGDPWLPVAVSFKGRSHPQIVMITETTRRRTVLDEESCYVVDFANIAFVDVTFRPYDWTVRGEAGTKAYLQTIYVIVEEDYLELKYSTWEEQSPHAIASGPSNEYDDYIDGDVVEDDSPLAIESGRR